MIPNSFYFLRHGETDWNIEERLQGHTDIPLNDTGRAQARAAIPYLQGLPIDRIIASPLVRALETAQIINSALQKPLETDARLMEKDFGLLEGMTPHEAAAWKAANPHKIGPIEPQTGNPAPPGGETYAQFHGRIFAAKKEYMTRYEGENLLFVAHGAVYRVLCRAFFNKTDFSPNARPFHFQRHAPEQWRLVDLQAAA